MITSNDTVGGSVPTDIMRDATTSEAVTIKGDTAEVSSKADTVDVSPNADAMEVVMIRSDTNEVRTQNRLESDTTDVNRIDDFFSRLSVFIPLQYIFEFLGPRDLLHVSAVSSLFLHSCFCTDIWFNHFHLRTVEAIQGVDKALKGLYYPVVDANSTSNPGNVGVPIATSTLTLVDPTIELFSKFAEAAVILREKLDFLTPLLKSLTLSSVCPLPRLTSHLRRLTEKSLASGSIGAGMLACGALPVARASMDGVANPIGNRTTATTPKALSMGTTSSTGGVVAGTTERPITSRGGSLSPQRNGYPRLMLQAKDQLLESIDKSPVKTRLEPDPTTLLFARMTNGSSSSGTGDTIGHASGGVGISGGGGLSGAVHPKVTIPAWMEETAGRRREIEQLKEELADGLAKRVMLEMLRHSLHAGTTSSVAANNTSVDTVNVDTTSAGESSANPAGDLGDVTSTDEQGDANGTAKVENNSNSGTSGPPGGIDNDGSQSLRHGDQAQGNQNDGNAVSSAHQTLARSFLTTLLRRNGTADEALGMLAQTIVQRRPLPERMPLLEHRFQNLDRAGTAEQQEDRTGQTVGGTQTAPKTADRTAPQAIGMVASEALERRQAGSGNADGSPLRQQTTVSKDANGNHFGDASCDEQPSSDLADNESQKTSEVLASEKANDEHSGEKENDELTESAIDSFSSADTTCKRINDILERQRLGSGPDTVTQKSIDSGVAQNQRFTDPASLSSASASRGAADTTAQNHLEQQELRTEERPSGSQSQIQPPTLEPSVSQTALPLELPEFVTVKGMTFRTDSLPSGVASQLVELEMLKRKRDAIRTALSRVKGLETVCEGQARELAEMEIPGQHSSPSNRRVSMHNGSDNTLSPKRLSVTQMISTSGEDFSCTSNMNIGTGHEKGLPKANHRTTESPTQLVVIQAQQEEVNQASSSSSCGAKVFSGSKKIFTDGEGRSDHAMTALAIDRETARVKDMVQKLRNGEPTERPDPLDDEARDRLKTEIRYALIRITYLASVTQMLIKTFEKCEKQMPFWRLGAERLAGISRYPLESVRVVLEELTPPIKLFQASCQMAERADRALAHFHVILTQREEDPRP